MIQEDAELTPIACLPGMTEIWQATMGWQPDSFQQQLFQQLYELILAGNRRLNLTRITEPEEFWEKHLWDSLRGIQRFLVPEANHAQKIAPEPPELCFKVIDIGTGAGFPGVPIAITQPGWTVTLLDSTRKKVEFINQVLATLRIDSATTLVDRAEQLGHLPAHRQMYDLAVIRAVASAPVCAEYALPLVKPGGLAVLYRGQWTDEEMAVLRSAAQQLGAEVESVEAFQTPLTQGDRHCIYLKKTAPTPAKFPRPVGVPAQQPLGE